jgi:hypothetical protein
MYKLNREPLNLLERDLIAGAVVKARGLRAGVIGDLLDALDSDAVLQIGGDASGPEVMVAGRFGQADCFRTALDYGSDHMPVIWRHRWTVPSFARGFAERKLHPLIQIGSLSTVSAGAQNQPARGA